MLVCPKLSQKIDKTTNHHSNNFLNQIIPYLLCMQKSPLRLKKWVFFTIVSVVFAFLVVGIFFSFLNSFFELQFLELFFKICSIQYVLTSKFVWRSVVTQFHVSRKGNCGTSNSYCNVFQM